MNTITTINPNPPFSEAHLLRWIEKEEQKHKEALQALEKMKQMLQKDTKQTSTNNTILKMPDDLHWGC